MNESIIPYFGDKNTLFYVKCCRGFQKYRIKVESYEAAGFAALQCAFQKSGTLLNPFKSDY
jgi:hypothetical protein